MPAVRPDLAQTSRGLSLDGRYLREWLLVLVEVTDGAKVADFLTSYMIGRCSKSRQMQRPEPRHPGQLDRSKWTSRDPALTYCHWLVIEVCGDDVVLQSVLERGTTLRLAWRALRVRERWHPGWQ